MLMTVLDRIWVQMGLRREELSREKGRGVLYAILLVAGSGSAFLATDLVLNLSGRFG